MENFTAVIGMFAATCTTLAFLPQVVFVWRTKNTQGLSIGMLYVFNTGVVLWLIYGLLRSDLIVIIANVVTFVLALYLLVMKIKLK